MGYRLSLRFVARAHHRLTLFDTVFPADAYGGLPTDLSTTGLLRGARSVCSGGALSRRAELPVSPHQEASDSQHGVFAAFVSVSFRY